MKNLLNRKFVFVFVIFCFAFSKSNYAQWYTSGSTIVYTNDKVGIGSYSPGQLLEIASYDGHPAPAIRLLFDNVGDQIWDIKNNGNLEFNYGVYPSTSNKVTFRTNGNVGIGTSSPNTKLDVRGGMYLQGKISFYSGGSWYNGIQNNSSGHMEFNVGPTAPVMKLTSNTVSIGCSASGSLNVNGKIQAKELEIKAGPCSDYVFEPDYNLMSISDLESYVKENKHLPEVPSAKEFEENGYNVGEMDDLLLRKVEELTLYVIDLENKIREMEEQE